jgi:hypothetical protein
MWGGYLYNMTQALRRPDLLKIELLSICQSVLDVMRNSDHANLISAYQSSIIAHLHLSEVRYGERAGADAGLPLAYRPEPLSAPKEPKQHPSLHLKNTFFNLSRRMLLATWRGPGAFQEGCALTPPPKSLLLRTFFHQTHIPLEMAARNIFAMRIPMDFAASLRRTYPDQP